MLSLSYDDHDDDDDDGIVLLIMTMMIVVVDHKTMMPTISVSIYIPLMMHTVDIVVVIHGSELGHLTHETLVQALQVLNVLF